MSSGPRVLGIVVAAACAFPLGCREKKVVVYREAPPQRVVVVERPQPPPPRVVVVEPPRREVVYIREAPPAPRHEIIVPRPSPTHVWIAGYYTHDHGHYAWVPGRWAAPPHRGAHWEPHHWEHGPHGYFIVEGRWR